MSRIYASVTELVERDITPALLGVCPGFDTDALVEQLRSYGLIERVDGESVEKTGYRLVPEADEEGGGRPSFWELVRLLDTFDLVCTALNADTATGVVDRFVVRDGLGRDVDAFQVPASANEAPYDEALAAAGWVITGGAFPTEPGRSCTVTRKEN